LFPNKNQNFYLTIVHTLPMLTQARLIICNICSLYAKGRLKTFGMVFRRPLTNPASRLLAQTINFRYNFVFNLLPNNRTHKKSRLLNPISETKLESR
jgi:hypothetical protein